MTTVLGHYIKTNSLYTNFTLIKLVTMGNDIMHNPRIIG
jgi:hypothetical protein